MIGSQDWPVVVTHSCADACAQAFGLAGRDQARQWLQELIPQGGKLTDRLPGALAGRRSPSGLFLVVEDVLALPLAADREGRPQWIATHCLAIRPRGHDRLDQPDPLGLRGRELLAQINVLPHAVHRFQQRCGGHPDPARARQELLDRLAPTVRAQRRPPAWCDTRSAQFYLIAGADDEYCLPCRPGSGVIPFDATTCIHPAGDLFALPPGRLRAACRLDTTAIPPGSHTERLITRALPLTPWLSWHRPRWAHPHPGARWWLVLAHRMAAPVAWEPDSTIPLVVLGLADHRPLLIRWLNRLRHRAGSTDQ